MAIENLSNATPVPTTRVLSCEKFMDTSNTSTHTFLHFYHLSDDLTLAHPVVLAEVVLPLPKFPKYAPPLCRSLREYNAPARIIECGTRPLCELS